jgi:choline dehydrogenase-like flavoprotein
MAENETEGVVNSFGQVFGIPNLFVAGGSIFPTTPCSNPTLTIVALALRTASFITDKVLPQ